MTSSDDDSSSSSDDSSSSSDDSSSSSEEEEEEEEKKGAEPPKKKPRTTTCTRKRKPRAKTTTWQQGCEIVKRMFRQQAELYECHADILSGKLAAQVPESSTAKTGAPLPGVLILQQSGTPIPVGMQSTPHDPEQEEVNELSRKMGAVQRHRFQRDDTVTANVKKNHKGMRKKAKTTTTTTTTTTAAAVRKKKTAPKKVKGSTPKEVEPVLKPLPVQSQDESLLNVAGDKAMSFDLPMSSK
jgi:hypothetical protein